MTTMTNREKYFLRRDEYDIMMQISENTGECPIDIITGQPHDCKGRECDQCVQDWLNEEE